MKRTPHARANGHRRRQLVARVMVEEDHCIICGELVDKTLRTLARSPWTQEEGQFAATVGGIIMSIAHQVAKTFMVGRINFALCILFPNLTVIWTAHRLGRPKALHLDRDRREHPRQGPTHADQARRTSQSKLRHTTRCSHRAGAAIRYRTHGKKFHMNVLQKFSLEGKVAVVTGGNRGLGRAMAEALGSAGAAVAVTARSTDAAQAAAAELAALGIRALGVSLEVTDPDDVERAMDEIESGLGPIDVLLNNAGISLGGAALDIPHDTWLQTLDTNLNGVWYCSRAVGHRMAARRSGTIINVGSMSAMIVNQPRWQPAYLASKAAVHQLTKALAAEWAPHGIRVNAMAPGYFLTEASPVDQPEYYESCVKPSAMKRYGTPDELGPLAVFLASEASSFMTGSVVVIDGGYTLF